MVADWGWLVDREPEIHVAIGKLDTALYHLTLDMAHSVPEDAEENGLVEYRARLQEISNVRLVLSTFAVTLYQGDGKS